MNQQNGLYRKTELSNGFTIVSEQMPSVRSACIGIWVPAGSRYEMSEENGVSHFLEHMFFKGTKLRSARDIAIEVDSLGGEMNAFTSREYTAYYVKVLDTHLSTALDILCDIFLRSVLDETELEKERQVILEEIRMQDDQPEESVHDMLNALIWQGHPLAFPIAGRQESVSAVNRESLLDYICRMYSRSGITISCAGHVDHDECTAIVEEQFGGVPPLQARDPLSRPRYQVGTKVVTKELEQVHVCLALPGIPLNDPERFPFYVLNTVLGANMSSRLFQEVREKRGLAYSVYSYLAGYQDVGNLAVYAGTSREKISEVIDVIRGELESLARKPLSDEEVKRSQEYLKGGLLMSLESSSSVMSRIAKQELCFHGYQSVDEIVQQIESVTPEKVQELAAKNFGMEQLSLAAIGPIQEDELKS
jgi:predicted Zn-dependent peptidase